ncbi:unnamed protein product, partial [Prorocentrum cordatum]
TGTITAWNMARPGKKNAEGYGFVSVDGQEDDSKTNNLFLYADNIKDSKLRSEAKIFGLKQGQRITFRIEDTGEERTPERLGSGRRRASTGWWWRRRRRRRRRPRPQALAVAAPPSALAEPSQA